MRIKKALLSLAVLASGFGWEVEVTPPSHAGLEGPYSYGNLPGLAALVYGILIVIVVRRTIDELPGVFAVRVPLGAVTSSYEYLWGPAILSVVLAFEWTGSSHRTSQGLEVLHVRYGLANGWSSAIAFALFVVLMLALKFHAAMKEANGRLPERQVTEVFE